ANVLTHLGRRAEAERLYRDAGALLAAEGERTLAAQVHYGLACLRFLNGEYAAAMAELEEVRPELARLGARPLLALADLDLAEVLLSLRLYPETLVLARSARGWFAGRGLAVEQARCELLMGLALAHLGRRRAAARLLAGAERRFQGQRHFPGVAAVDLARGELARLRGRPLSAARRARRAHAGFARAGFALRALAAGALACEALLEAG